MPATRIWVVDRVEPPMAVVVADDDERQVDVPLARPFITYLASEPRAIHLGDVSVEVLATHPARRHGNDGFVALLVRYGKFSVLLTGDVETEALDYLVTDGAVPDITVLKASHHGSDNVFTEDPLAEGRPEVVVISVGAATPMAILENWH
ncbi:MAG: hypothetical protein OXU74_03695 [Gemmatimonadota bacterium]|nr:hypothetical protein [Gemmatimonadota bacterium]